MEEFSNGQIEVAQKVETDEEDNRGVAKEFEELKPEVESVREIVVDGNSESFKETHDVLSSDSSNSPEEEAEAKDQSLSAKDSGTLEEEVKKDVTDIIIESAESIVPLPQVLSSTTETSIEKSQEPEVTEVEQKEIEVKIFPSSNETNEKTTLDETDGGVSEVVSDGSKETRLPSSDDKRDLSAIATDTVSEGVEEAKVIALEENTGEPSGFVDKESEENTDDSLKPSNNATIVGSSDGFPESKGNPHVTSLSQRTLQRTSWRSCCGLFEVLRRSNR
ncbi:hypothetical protein GH714_014703 [Hevea brasiliensis]|uniref:Uncharacterized protein n=1 Tax=Hevea brasiliensis TaxID=3981 RepID=A0A6A6KQ00_HEVBR|nr:hypothetical protein GH714_014703 [Hevea brasiliensis]